LLLREVVAIQLQLMTRGLFELMRSFIRKGPLQPDGCGLRHRVIRFIGKSEIKL